ncbi:MAG TPA: polysaccharide biosynthesis protein [Desulfuromonadales bacterium]|nr:polysaccharide biosynthesis protein [Desulfuromonadales bacterium]
MMQIIIRVFVLMSALAMIAVASASAVRAAESDALYPKSTKSSGTTTLSKDELMIKVLEERELQNELQNPAESPSELEMLTGEPLAEKDTLKENESLKGATPLSRQKQKKSGLVLKSEPGDGLVRLSWKPFGWMSRSDDRQLRFTIRYGIESEKLTKNIAVGPGTEYILRELKNYQPYYIQVIALDREQKEMLKSDEMRITPLPADEQGSRIERTFSRKSTTLFDKTEPVSMIRELKQFGYDFFKNSLQLTSAIDAMPVSAHYILGPGDVVNLTVWGAVNLRQELTVGRNGELLIPKVGSVRVWGLPFEQAKKDVNTAMSRYFRNYEMSLTLGKLRSIQVYVVGEVEAPGNYPVSSLATVINALAAAGGPSHNGSLRNVKVTRGNQTLAMVDLYDMLLSGDRSKDLQLENGDTIFVPVIGAVVAVAGEVRRPAIYELNGKTTLPELLKMAGGVAASGSLGRIQIERLENNNSRIALDYYSKGGDLQAELGAVTLQDRDMLKVFPIQTATRQIVSLQGNVQQLGDYQFRPGMRLTDLIPSTQALLPESYLDSVEISRMTPPDYQRHLITVSLRRALAGNPVDNLLLQEQDAVKVFSRWEMEEKPRVAVNGAVVNPGRYDFFPGMAVRDLVTAAGSVKRNAFFDQAELSRVVISGDRAQATRLQLNLGKALAGDSEHNLPLQSDDVLIVRGVSDWQDATDKFVTLKGEVRFPGVYSLARGERLSSVITRAGGFTEKAYLRGGKFTRRSVQQSQQKRMEEITVKSEKDIQQKQAALASLSASKEELEATKSALEGLLKGVERMKSLKAEGRVVLRLSAVNDLKKGNYDLELEGGDQLEVPPRPGVVSVLGQVYNPTSFIFLADKDVDHYLQKSGGGVNDAELSEMYVIRADGTVFSRQQSSFGIQWSEEGGHWSFGSFLSSPLEAGDTLVVPQKLERTAWMRDIKDFTQILANVALTAGTVMIGLK